MLIIRPFIFRQFPEIKIGFASKIGPEVNSPYYFNLSYSVGDEKFIVDRNRKFFFEELGLSVNQIGFQKQVHEDLIREVDSSGYCGESDAMITTSKNLGLAISSADCPAIFIYDPVKKILAAVHSGWRGTEKKILQKTITKLNDEYNSNSTDLVCYIGPSISVINYEVGQDVAEKFDDQFVIKNNNKYFLDVARANYKMLIDEGVKKVNIQKSCLCSFEYEELLHSYRRDGQKSGRAIGVIAMRDKV